MATMRDLLRQLEGEPPDVDDAPTPQCTRERRWRFELPELRPVYLGRCKSCGGQHIPDQNTLDQLIEWVGELGWAVPPCTCRCCST